MEKFDIENLQSINYYQRSNSICRNTYMMRSSEASATGSETATSETTSESYSSTSTGSGTNVSTLQTDKIDSIKSCESILKIFSFESRGFTKWNVKCTDFWKLINSHPEIKPVNCVIMDAHHNKRDAGVQTDQQESEASFWARALYELQKRNLHKVALAGSQKKCKFCADHGGDYESDADEDITQLNKWHGYRKGAREASASTISSDQINLESKQFVVNLGDFENVNQPQMDMYESSDIKDEEATNEGSVEFLPVPTEQSLEQSTEQLELFDFHDTEQLLEPTYMIDTETTESLEGALNVTDISENPTIEEEWEDLQLVTPTSDLSLADELNRELLRRLSEAITNMMEEGDYWDVVTPITSKSSKGKEKTSKEFVKSILEEKIDEEIDRKEEIEIIPVPEVEPSQEKLQPEVYVHSLRENYNHAQKILSMLGIDFEEYKQANTLTKTNILRETLKENYSKFILKEPEDPVVCPCTQELKVLTKSECTCEAGICKPPKELDAEEMEFVKQHLPYGPGVECFRTMIEGIHAMKEKDLTVQEQSEEIKNILLKIQNRETTDGPCECILHTIDVQKIEEDAKYMKDMILTNLDQKLDEKYEDLIGIRRTESKEVQIEQCVKVPENEKVERMVCADICEECGALICKCGKKKKKIRKKSGMKHKKDATGSCTIDCGCHLPINC